jgi:hypothetical protein
MLASKPYEILHLRKSLKRRRTSANSLSDRLLK